MKFFKNRMVFPLICLISVFSLVSCNPAPAATDTPPPPQTSPSATVTPVPASQTPTPIPPSPTTTPIPKTSTPTRLPTRTPNWITEPDILLGVWLGTENRDGMFYQFNADGTYKVATSRRLLESQPNVEGTYYFEGNELTFTMTGVHDLPDCGFTDSTYRVEKISADQVKFYKVEDTCSPRVRTMMQLHQRQP